MKNQTILFLGTILRKMIINTEHKIIYLSNCKCASSTVRKHFWQVRDIELIEKVQEYGLGNPHMPYDKVLKVLDQEGVNTEGFFLFSTIRNPWERIVSLYNYCKPDKNAVPFWGTKFGKEYDEGTSCSFEKFIFSSLYCDYNKTAGSFRHACKNIQDMFGEDYSKFKLYKSEELDVNKIMDDINDPSLENKVGRAELKIVDSSHWHIEKEKRDSENYREYYNDELRDIIANHYELDIKIGEYEF